MRVGIVGAGMAGLAAARRLKAQGHEVVVFEKSRGFGGRVSTRRVGDYTFDSGTTSIAPRTPALHQMMFEGLDASELVRIEKPIYVHTGLRTSRGDAMKNALPRYAYLKGNNTLGKLLGAGMDVRLQSPVEALEKGKAGYRVLGEVFDALVLTPPAPQTMDLLSTIGEHRPLANVQYRPCLSVMMGYEKPFPETPYHAIIEPEQRHPLTWLCLESVKCPGRAPAGHAALVAQMSPAFSRSHFEDEPRRVAEIVSDYIERLFGTAFAAPTCFDVMRWRYSHAEAFAWFDNVNPPGSRLVVASDGLIASRVEMAYECGIRAADVLAASYQ